ncbi:MAG: ATP-binding protein [Planctomycetota bacterium]|nr:ATP-binding protein [Planctomycetota bacterium]
MEAIDLAHFEFSESNLSSVARRDDFRLRLPTKPIYLNMAKGIAERFLRAHGLTGQDLANVLVAFKEALANSERHGNGSDDRKRIHLRFSAGHARLALLVDDEGEGFDHRGLLRETLAKSPTQSARERHQMGQLGGLGIHLMVKCTDYLEYRNGGRGVTLVKEIGQRTPTLENRHGDAPR